MLLMNSKCESAEHQCGGPSNFTESAKEMQCRSSKNATHNVRLSGAGKTITAHNDEIDQDYAVS